MKASRMNEGYATLMVISLITFVMAAGALYFAVSAFSDLRTSRSVASRTDLGELADLGSAIMTESELENKIEAIVERKKLADMDSEEYDRMMAKDYFDNREGVYAERPATATPGVVPEADNLQALFKAAKTIPLKDMSGAGVLSRAWLGVHNNITYHRVAARGLPLLSGTDYYEGWLVRDPAAAFDMFSTGRMKYDPVT